MPKLKLTANVAEFGLFQGLARTRARLVASTLAITGAMIGLALWSADYVLHQSSSVGLNLLVITANMGLVMTAAYMQALLIGDLFFPGPWREQVVLGLRPDAHDHDAEIAVRNHNAEFMIVLLLLIVGDAMLVNGAAGGFVDTYHAEGFFRVRMRQDDASERLQALRDMVEPTQQDLWTVEGVRQVVLQALGDGDAQVRAQAAWNAGAMGLDAAREPLIALLSGRDEAPEVRQAAAEALGRLGKSLVAREAITGLLHEPGAPDALRVSALRGLGLMRDEESWRALLTMTTHPSPEVWRYAYWALRELPARQARQAILEQLQDEPAGERLCALLDTLKMLATEEDIPWAQRQFMRADPTLTCQELVWEDRDERRRYILYYDSPRTKYVKIVANSGGAPAHKRWFELIASDPSEPWPVRETAGLVLKQLR